MNHVAVDFAEMSRQIRTFQRRIVAPVVTLLVAVVVLMGAAIFAVERFGLDTEPPGELTQKRVIVMTCWFSGMLISVIVCCWLVPKPPRFVCPQCGDEFANRYDQMTVLSTGYCPKCIQPLFASPGGTTGETAGGLLKGMTRAEFKRHLTELRPFNPLVSGLCGLIVTVICFAGATMWDEARRPSDEQYQLPVYRFGVVVLGGGLTIGYIAMRSRARLRDLNLCRCEDCGEAIGEDSVTLITGACCHCGSRVLSDQLPIPLWPQAKCLWDRSWYREHGRRWHKWGWVSCIIGAVPAFVWIAFVFWFCPPSNPHRLTAASMMLGAVAPILQGISTCIGRWWLHRRLAMNCPQCLEPLADVPQFVMPSRNCPFCQTTILAD